MSQVKVGLIGGTGLAEALQATEGVETVEMDTPFGKPSDAILTGRIEGTPVAILSRHGPGHRLHPSDVPYRANIYALKALGCTHVIASGATGSLRKKLRPGQVVIPDQAIDKTYRRIPTFFDGQLAAHVEFSEPFCPQMRNLLLAAAEGAEFTVHDGGAYVCMEGPAFSTRAESRMHRKWGGDLIGMTCMPEAKLAREAELSYALVAFPTDYDCWRPHEPDATAQSLLDELLANLKSGTENAMTLIRRALAMADQLTTDAPAHGALKMAIFSEKSQLGPEVTDRLGILVEKYL